MAERTDTPHKIAEMLRAVIGKTEKKYYTSAVILAAGSSTRMGEGQSKQFLELCGIPVVARTVIEFEKSEFIVYNKTKGGSSFRHDHIWRYRLC